MIYIAIILNGTRDICQYSFIQLQQYVRLLRSYLMVLLALSQQHVGSSCTANQMKPNPLIRIWCSGVDKQKLTTPAWVWVQKKGLDNKTTQTLITCSLQSHKYNFLKARETWAPKVTSIWVQLPHSVCTFTVNEPIGYHSIERKELVDEFVLYRIKYVLLPEIHLHK